MAEDANPSPTALDHSASGNAAPSELTSKSPGATRLPKDTDTAMKNKDALSDVPTDAAEKTEQPPGGSVAENDAAESRAPAESENVADKEERGAGAVPTSDPGANGTPLSKKSNNGKRKSSSVPEHRSKKLSKKKSAARITHLDAQPGEYYFARLKSYAPWPSIICDEEMLPQTLLSTRPVTTKQKDGTYGPAYGDGGKRVHERTFPIMFLQTNEFAWIPNTDLTPLDPESCKNVGEKGKSKNLIAAYHIAAENHDLQYFKDMLAEHQRAMQEDLEEREARAAAKAAKEEKKKRKSMDVADDHEDEEMADVGEEKRKSAKKRKKEVESDDGESEKPTKTPKTTTKLKLTTPKTPTTGETGKKATGSAKAPKGKNASTKKSAAKAAVSDEETPAETLKESEKPLDPQEAKTKKEREVLYLRHKLQKGFLSRDQAPKEEEMSSMSDYIKKLETYADLEVSIIRATKINKVLKAIIKLNSIPKDEEYDFRGRSINILGKWKNLLDSDLPTAGVSASAAGDKSANAKPTANGVHKRVNDKREETTEGDDEAAADDDDPMLDVSETKTQGAEAEDEESSIPGNKESERVAIEA